MAHKKNIHLRNTLALSIFFLFFQSSCGLLIGNIKPVEEKSGNYRVMDLSQKNSDWVRLKRSTSSGSDQTDYEDIAYQSKKSASIISLNSACRSTIEAENKGLEEYTHLLLLGITEPTQKEEKNLTLHGLPALQTTVEAVLNKKRVKIRTLVLQKKDCVYDLMYIARPDRFSENETTFIQFVDSLKLKE